MVSLSIILVIFDSFSINSVHLAPSWHHFRSEIVFLEPLMASRHYLMILPMNWDEHWLKVKLRGTAPHERGARTEGKPVEASATRERSEDGGRARRGQRHTREERGRGASP